MVLRRLASTPWGSGLADGWARLAARHPWSHNDHFHGWIVTELPPGARSALDVGCGEGELAAVLARHVGRVHAVDADAAMRGATRRRCLGLDNVVVGDERLEDIAGPVDVVTMVAVLHHLDLVPALREVRRLLAPGGRLLVVGLAAPRSVRDHAWDAASILANPVIGYVVHPWPNRSGPVTPAFPVRDPTMSFDEIRREVAAVLPGARMRHRIGFRYTLTWTKPA